MAEGTTVLRRNRPGTKAKVHRFRPFIYISDLTQSPVEKISAQFNVDEGSVTGGSFEIV